jgi:hypothetical protein
MRIKTEVKETVQEINIKVFYLPDLYVEASIRNEAWHQDTPRWEPPKYSWSAHDPVDHETVSRFQAAICRCMARAMRHWLKIPKEHKESIDAQAQR